MAHYKQEAWVDFANNVISPTTKMTMQEHLDGGCKGCATTLQVWQNMLEFGRRESSLTPSAESVRVVESFFVSATLEAPTGFRLLFDSLLQPATAGVRGTATARQFLYETDDLYIDLRMEHSGPENALLVGQVLRRNRDASSEGIVVRVMDQKHPLAETVTNRFGEFQLEFKPVEKLCFSIAGNDLILPLYGHETEPVSRKSRNLRG